MASMILYDLCLPWYWEYDDAFVGLIERACVRQGKTFWQVTSHQPAGGHHRVVQG